jgi:hypothetical protein
MSQPRRIPAWAALALATAAAVLAGCGVVSSGSSNGSISGKSGFYSSQTTSVSKKAVRGQATTGSSTYSPVIAHLYQAGFEVEQIEIPVKHENPAWYADFKCAKAPAGHSCDQAPRVVLTLDRDPGKGPLTLPAKDANVTAATAHASCMWQDLDPEAKFRADWIWDDLDGRVQKELNSGSGSLLKFGDYELFCQNRNYDQ